MNVYYITAKSARRVKHYFRVTPLGVMLKASQAIVIDENFGPKAIAEKADMPALQSTNL